MKKVIIERAKGDPEMDPIQSGSTSSSSGQESSPVFRIQQHPPGNITDNRYVKL